MATQVQRSAAIIGNIRDKTATPAGNAVVTRYGEAYARAYPSEWNALLKRRSLAENPNSEDVTDIGTLSAEVFTPLVNGDRRRILAQHFRLCLRRFCEEIVVNDEMKNTKVKAADAGKTPEQILAASKASSLVQLAIDLGDPNNDEET